MADIALTSSMRSNLLSLSSTQDLMDTTQERLSSGYAVNSAMDNPSSYFTAQSLESRSSDLSTLLDSIGQAISTLEVADEGITSLQDFVEQAQSIANSARDTANISSSVTTDSVEFNSSTAKEDLLTDVVNNISAGDSFTIRLGDSTTMEATSNVSADQTLSEVGIAEDGVIEMIVGDQIYEFTFVADGSETSAVTNADGTISQSISVDSTLEDFMAEVVYTVGRTVLSAEITDGKLSFSTMDNSSLVIRSTGTFDSGNEAVASTIDTKATSFYAGTYADDQYVEGATIQVGTDTAIDISNLINVADGTIDASALVDRLNDAGYSAQLNADGTTVEILTGETVSFVAGTGAGGTDNGASTVTSSASVTASQTVAVMTDFNEVFGFDSGMTVTVTENMTVEEFRQAIDDLDGISADIDSSGNLVITGDEGDDMVIADLGDSNLVNSLLGDNIVSATNGSNERATYAEQFDDILQQIDELVQDTSYKGINLLMGDDLEVIFNETRTSSLTIEGVTFDSTGLGLTASANEWASNDDIDAALDQITAATSLLRVQASEFGQNLSTVQIREDFTETMINNLTTGADKLTLADMNEEAANMLALQTRQSLGINSLSLASQSAQSVLNLF